MKHPSAHGGDGHSNGDDGDCDDGGGEKKFPLHLCPALSTVAYLIPFLSAERPSQCYHLTKEVPSMHCTASEYSPLFNNRIQNVPPNVTI